MNNEIIELLTEIRDLLKPKEKKRKEKSSSVFNLPNWINGDTWNAFVEHRIKLKAPMTVHAKNLMIKKLGKLGGIANDILNQSISSGYRGVFEIKPENNNAAHKQTSKPSLAERATTARREYEQQNNDEPVGAAHTYIRP